MYLDNILNNNSKFSSPPLKVKLKRGASIESTHNVHAVVSDSKGRVLMKSGKSDYQTFIRSALKPYQAVPFISSGAYQEIHCSDKGLAISCGSHQGTKMHAREVFKILWDSRLEVDNLKCPIPKNKTSRLEHNCSGKHAAFLSTCKKMNWDTNNYLEASHPLQKEIFRRVAEILRLPQEELIAERDDCGAPTLLLQLSQIGLLYAYLGSAKDAQIEQITRAMMAHPELVAGTGKFDTELMKDSHGQLLSKGGAEGVQCISRLGEGLAMAIKVEDGSRRAKHAVALHLLNQLEWIMPSSLQSLEERVMLISQGVQLEVEGSLKFVEN